MRLVAQELGWANWPVSPRGLPVFNSADQSQVLMLCSNHFTGLNYLLAWISLFNIECIPKYSIYALRAKVVILPSAFASHGTSNLQP